MSIKTAVQDETTKILEYIGKMDPKDEWLSVPLAAKTQG